MDRSYVFLIALCFSLFFTCKAFAQETDEFMRLKLAYPDSIKEVTNSYISWADGKRMLIRHLPLIDSIIAAANKVDTSIGSISRDDIRHDSYEAFFRKMYGNSPKEVQEKLVTIYWMPHVFGKKYPLKVTTVNDVDKRLARISEALEKLPSSFHKYVDKPASSYYWRNVAKEEYLSMHSFGIAIDINLDYSNYWLWDYMRSKKTLKYLTLRNKIPMEIVEIFEKEGFVWGGRWYHYDTMHFEYRPEFFV